MEWKEGEALVFAIIILVVLGLFVVLLFLIFLKRKNLIIKSNAAAEKQFKQEIINTQIEIREETLRNISWELHDNIGQIMTLAKIQAQNARNNPDKIEEVAEIIGKGLSELRSLSKMINPDFIKNLKLDEAIRLELDRFNRLNFIETSFNIKGEKVKIDSKETVILFRILQEFFTNTIKHSQATNLDVSLDYSNNILLINAKDNGIGFQESQSNKKGIGLKNIKNRARLIGAKITINSRKNMGTQLKLIYYIKEK